MAQALRLSLLVAVIIAIISLKAPAQADDAVRFIRIGTGSTSGTYFPVGGLIANIISNPPGSMACELGGSCGVPGLVAAAVSTQGSVDNVVAVGKGTLDMGMSQADVAYFAYRGQGLFAKQGALPKLRAIANLYLEMVHVVVRTDSGIASIGDLKGQRVAVGEPNSGTLVVAKQILSDFGLSVRSIKPIYARLGRAADDLIDGSLDAFFMVGGYPLTAVSHAADTVSIKLLPITGPKIDTMLKNNPFFAKGVIADGVYAGVPATETISVGAQLIVSQTMDDDLAYEITRALWDPRNEKLLQSGHPMGRLIHRSTALTGIAIPLHPGAARYYREHNLLTAETP